MICFPSFFLFCVGVWRLLKPPCFRKPLAEWLMYKGCGRFPQAVIQIDSHFFAQSPISLFNQQLHIANCLHEAIPEISIFVPDFMPELALLSQMLRR